MPFSGSPDPDMYQCCDSLELEEMVRRWDNPVCHKPKTHKFLEKLPSELQEMVVERLQLTHLARFMKIASEKRYEERFKKGCIKMKWPLTAGKYARWLFEFKQILTRHVEAECRSMICRDLDFPIFGQPWFYGPNSFNSGLPLTMCVVLKRPRDSNKEIMRNMRVVGWWDHLIEAGMELGNPYDLQMADKIETTRTYFTCNACSQMISFDYEYRVYYQNGNRFYRKSLTSNEPAEFLVSVEGWKVFAAGKEKFFVACCLPTPTIVCYDITTKMTCQIVDQELHIVIADEDRQINNSIAAHNNSFVTCGCNGTTLIYTVRNNQISRTKISSYERKRLNQDTHLILVDEGKEKVALKTLNIIDDRPIQHFVQYCERVCFVERLEDSLFVVLEPNKRTFWYEDKPGYPCDRLHTDSKKTKFHLTKYGVEFLPCKERKKRRRSI